MTAKEYLLQYRDIQEEIGYIMQQIEEVFSAVSKFTLDTPIWNVRTNAFYQKLG